MFVRVIIYSKNMIKIILLAINASIGGFQMAKKDPNVLNKRERAILDYIEKQA